MEEELASSRSATHGGTTLKECQRMIHKSLQLKSLREHMDKAGCPVRDNFFMAVNCNQGTAGGYIQGEGIVVCSDQIGSQDEVNQVIMHELIHAFDDCRAANLDWLNCAHHACSEIRANHLSGDCHYKRELLRGFWKVKGHEQVQQLPKKLWKLCGMSVTMIQSLLRELLKMDLEPLIWELPHVSHVVILCLSLSSYLLNRRDILNIYEQIDRNNAALVIVV
ncbi:mitochondrial inner membrane protease ATP23-like isoform X2 [Lotus japonicus]|uniref:mitochondrial inner membrane protease ATP23-like isoform X2 n=1 Tax=Lotus japonicus TaxID=34305 RepID=UPI0025908904|nr:mitochondrial inner membrane protease ATP23-like isoform X2 [Lotus japonicus]